jgi:hypothetical protein
MHLGRKGKPLTLSLKNISPDPTAAMTSGQCLKGHHKSTIMLKFWRINHVSELEWKNNPLDLCTFIVVLAVKEHEFGTSTYVLSKAMLNKFTVIGHFSVKLIPQFDVKTESGCVCLKEGAPIIGRNALQVFLDSYSHKPFVCAELE